MRYRTCDFGAAGEVPSRGRMYPRGPRRYRTVYDDAPLTPPAPSVGLAPCALVINLRSRKGGWNIISTKRLQTHADTCTH